MAAHRHKTSVHFVERHAIGGVARWAGDELLVGHCVCRTLHPMTLFHDIESLPSASYRHDETNGPPERGQRHPSAARKPIGMVQYRSRIGGGNRNRFAAVQASFRTRESLEWAESTAGQDGDGRSKADPDCQPPTRRGLSILARLREAAQFHEKPGVRTSDWRPDLPLEGQRARWQHVRVGAEMTEDEPNSRIAWQSVSGSEVPNSGNVRFARATGDCGTLLTVELRYAPPGGAVGATEGHAGATGTRPSDIESARRHHQGHVDRDLRLCPALIQRLHTNHGERRYRWP